MKKLAALVGSILLFAATTAGAEHRLLVTDVVEPGHVEGQAAWEFTHYNEDVNGNVSEMTTSLGIGLAKNLEFDVALPYVFKESIKFDDEVENKKSWGNLQLGAKYRILNEQPVSVTASFDLGINTGSDSNSEGHNLSYIPAIAVSKDLGHETKPYVLYRAKFNSNGPDTHTLSVGLEKELNHFVTLDAKFDTTFYVNGAGFENDLKVYSFDLGAYLQLVKNVYLIPSLGVSRLSGDEGYATGLKGGAALYLMF